jgi:hypothetical protein
VLPGALQQLVVPCFCQIELQLEQDSSFLAGFDSGMVSSGDGLMAEG